MIRQNRKQQNADKRVTFLSEFNRIYFPKDSNKQEMIDSDPFLLGAAAARNSLATIKAKIQEAPSRKNR